MFAMQIVDGRSEDGMANQTDLIDVLEGQNEASEQDAINDANGPKEDQGEQMKQENCPKGSQYDDEPPYKEFDGFATLSDDEPEYICMMHELETSTSSAPLQFEDAEWQVRRNAIRMHYQCDPWMPNNSIEFSPLNGITHSHCCGICVNYKEHMLITKVMEESCYHVTATCM